MRDALRLALSETPPEEGESGAELAAKIKALRESVTVEAAPERTVRKAARAERPVTARIRERRAEVQAGPDGAGQPEISRPDEKLQEVQVTRESAGPAGRPEPVQPPAVVIPMPEPVKPVPAKPVEDFRQAVVKRRGDGRQLSLF